jgi:hypothetical protein
MACSCDRRTTDGASAQLSSRAEPNNVLASYI